MVDAIKKFFGCLHSLNDSPENSFDLYQKRCRKSSLFSKSVFNDLLEELEFAEYVKLSFKLRMSFMTFKDIRGKLAHDKDKSVEVELIDSAFNKLDESIDEIAILPISQTIWSKIGKSKVVFNLPSPKNSCGSS